jgi:hypothetical protein
MSGYVLQPCVSQDVSRINLNEIPQRKVRNFIVSRSIDKMDDFSSIHASWTKKINKSDFKTIEKIFILKHKLSDVWEFYRHTSSFRMWNGKSIGFGLMIAKHSKVITYAKSFACPEVDTAQVYFLDIRFIKGLFNIPVAFEIINIDTVQKLVEFSYIDNNKSAGKQTIQFFDDGDGRTRIVHSSFFKSESALRDKLLYPYFHKKFIREFHGNMRNLINDKVDPVIALK